MSANKLINKSGGRSQRSMGSIVVTILVALALWYFNGGLDNLGNQTSEPSQSAAQTQQSSQSGGLVEANSNSQVSDTNAPVGMPLIAIGELPPEARDTINLIWSDGPYPFDKDDTTFQNREGFLPDEARGYYREYTVITPGLNHRGARRIVAGAEGELYYTSDHYESFSWVVVE